MDRKKQINAMAETDEERMLLVRVCDRLDRAQQREQPAMTAFLSPHEQAMVKRLLPHADFFGGMEGTERTVAYWLPDYLTPEDYFTEGGISCLRCTFHEEAVLTHRDILGALMGTGIRRDAVGDICLHGNTCDIFVLSELTGYLLDQLTSAGRWQLKPEEIPLSLAEKLPVQLKELRVTVSSLRLDSVISAAFHRSRGNAQTAVNAGNVQLNSMTCYKPDRLISQGDEISVRGLGKLRVLSVLGITKKDRISLLLGIFQ